jgi:pimeloyl-ACP methyl ester carboxylesterase
MQTLSSKRIIKSSLEIPKIIQFIAQFLQLLSPKLAVYFAAKLFTTPIRFKTPKRELIMAKSAQQKKLHIKAINETIDILSYGYSKKKVLLVHGWSGRSTQLFMIADKLLEKGYMVITFDGPAHGKSSGKTTNLKEFIATIDAVNDKFGPFEAAVGHSFGALALLNISGNKELFKSLVTIGSGNKFTQIVADFTKNLGLKREIQFKLKTYLEKKWNTKTVDFAGSEVAKKIKIPTLVIHDTEDGDVPVSSSSEIRQNLQNGSLLISSGLGHAKILRHKNTVEKVVNFITKNS